MGEIGGGGNVTNLHKIREGNNKFMGGKGVLS